MRILIDTNIVIYREDDRVLSANLQRLLALLSNLGVSLLVHPLSVKDIEQDSNKDRRQVILSKIKTYPFLEEAPNPAKDDEYQQQLEVSNREANSVDNHILYALYKDAVDFLITEDKGIHKKARRLGLGDRVFLIVDAINTLGQLTRKEWAIPPPALKEEFVYNLNPKDPIFDSLRDDYPEFDEWFKKISRQGRKCFIYRREDGTAGALLIFKIENEQINSNPPLGQKRRLKISAFKVTHVGYKLGELLIKLSIDTSIKNNLDEIYLTVFTEKYERLVELITDFGFSKVAINSRGETVFVKRLVPDPEEAKRIAPSDIAKIFYPSYFDGEGVRKFIIPIRQQYHSRLFTDYPERQLSLAEFAGEFITEGNTITKAYICHAKSKQMGAADVILFYLSGRQTLTSVGVVETVHRDIKDSNHIIRLVGKRTVYTTEEIEEISKEPTMVILFRHHFHLKKAISLAQLRAMGALSSAPQSIVKISNRNYLSIKQRGGIDERFTFN